MFFTILLNPKNSLYTGIPSHLSDKKRQIFHSLAVCILIQFMAFSTCSIFNFHVIKNFNFLFIVSGFCVLLTWSFKSQDSIHMILCFLFNISRILFFTI